MSIGILGTKIGMTQLFSTEGFAIPVTIVYLESCVITQIKTTKTDGYNAIQIGCMGKISKHLTKARRGHLKQAGVRTIHRLTEYRVLSTEKFEVGDLITIKEFHPGQAINISGLTIGKGFAGNQKRHNFRRGPMTHGSKTHRQPGSIGPGTTPGRVFPGKRMAGRLGHKTVTIKNLQIADVNISQNCIGVKGAVPGPNGNLLKIITR